MIGTIEMPGGTVMFRLTKVAHTDAEPTIAGRVTIKGKHPIGITRHEILTRTCVLESAGTTTEVDHIQADGTTQTTIHEVINVGEAIPKLEHSSGTMGPDDGNQATLQDDGKAMRSGGTSITNEDVPTNRGEHSKSYWKTRVE